MDRVFQVLPLCHEGQEETSHERVDSIISEAGDGKWVAPTLPSPSTVEGCAHHSYLKALPVAKSSTHHPSNIILMNGYGWIISIRFIISSGRV